MCYPTDVFCFLGDQSALAIKRGSGPLSKYILQ